MNYVTKKGIISLLLFISIAFITNAQEISMQQGPQITSPDIADNNTVTFNVYSPTANSIAVSGSWVGGENIQLKKMMMVFGLRQWDRLIHQCIITI